MARERLGASERQRHFVLAGRRINLVRLHDGERRLLLGWRGRHDLDAHQLRRHRFAETLTHGLEQAERLGFVLVERIALTVAAQPDDLTQVIEHDEVLAP